METLSSFMSQIVDEVSKSNSPVNIKIIATIYNSSNPDISIEPLIIDKLEIRQAFLINYLDEIVLYGKFLPNDVYTMIKNIEDLRCRLTFKYINENTFEIDTNVPFIIKEYNVYIPNIEDLYKISNIDRVYKEDNAELEQQVGTTIPVALQLLDDLNYVFRKKTINIGFQKSNMKDIVLFICKKFGLKKIYLEEQYFNSLIYQNIYIPPNYGRLNILLDYMQKRYGIYPHGISYYYYDNVLYIYQPYFVTDISKINLPPIKIFKIPYKSNLGNYSTYRKIDSILHVIINSDVDSTPVNLKMLEEETLITYLNSGRIFNNIDVTKSGVNLTNILHSSGVDNKINRVKKNSLFLNHTESSINSFLKSSEISEKTTELVSFNWNYSLPFSVLPGNPVQFIYEKDNDIIYQQGRVENISFIFNRLDQTFTSDSIFLVMSNVQLRLNTFSRK